MTDTPSYHVTITRDGEHWVGTVDGLSGGATQALTLATLEDEVRDLVSGLTDTDPETLELDTTATCIKCRAQIYISNPEHADKHGICWHDIADDDCMCPGPEHPSDTADPDPDAKYFHRPALA